MTLADLFQPDFAPESNTICFLASNLQNRTYAQEAERILGDAINLCRLGQLTLHGGPPPSHNRPMITEEKVKPAEAGKGQ